MSILLAHHQSLNALTQHLHTQNSSYSWVYHELISMVQSNSQEVIFFFQVKKCSRRLPLSLGAASDTTLQVPLRDRTNHSTANKQPSMQ